MALVEVECKSFYVKNADNKTKKIDFRKNFKEVIGKKFNIDVENYTFEHYDGKFNLSLDDDEDFSRLSSDSLINIIDKNNGNSGFGLKMISLNFFLPNFFTFFVIYI